MRSIVDAAVRSLPGMLHKPSGRRAGSLDVTSSAALLLEVSEGERLTPPAGTEGAETRPAASLCPWGVGRD